MGDRAYMSLICRFTDRTLFEAKGFYLAETLGEGLIEMVDEERNYANTDDLPKSVPFYGSHGAGCDYGPGAFACDGERFEYTETLHEGAEPVVHINHDGSVNPDEVDHACIWWSVHNAAKAALESTDGAGAADRGKDTPTSSLSACGR